MAKQRNRKPVRRRDRKGPGGGGRRKPCPFCKDKIEQVDYKDVGGLRKFVSERGKIRSRRITGACRRHQSQIATAVKRARELALLPYAAEPSAKSAPAAAATAAIATATATARRCPRRSCSRTSRRSASAATVVDVSKGYLRNYLIPRKLAQPATKGALEAAQRARPPTSACARRPPAAPQENAALLNKTVLTIPQQAGDDGRLFGSVTTQDIADAIRDARGIRSTSARSTSTSRSATSAPTWSSWRSADGVTATVKTMVVAQK